MGKIRRGNRKNNCWKRNSQKNPDKQMVHNCCSASGSDLCNILSACAGKIKTGNENRFCRKCYFLNLLATLVSYEAYCPRRPVWLRSCLRGIHYWNNIQKSTQAIRASGRQKPEGLLLQRYRKGIG